MLEPIPLSEPDLQGLRRVGIVHGGLRMSCLLIFLANGSAECWSLHIFPGIVVDVGNPSASIPSGLSPCAFL